MRVSVLNMILLLSVSLQFLQATTVTGQNIDEIYITMGAENESLKDVLKKINEKTNLRITYLTKHVEPYANISFPVEERSVREVLELVLGGAGLKYKQVNSYVYIEKNDEDYNSEDINNTSSLENDAILFFTITGKVMDTKGVPIAGVNIIVKGTATGTTTDIEGKYSINANEEDILVFTFIGFKTYEAHVATLGVIDVTLEEEIKSLQEVEINAGYWTVKKEQQAGNIVKIRAEEIQKQPVSNPIAALQGRVSGLEITQGTGVPGGNFTVRIRGQNSIVNGSDPLYVVDGVPYISTTLALRETSAQIYSNGTSPLNSINPSDIESIEVLKDADATAIFGSRGANGVILITTKRGSVGKTKINFNLNAGVGKVTSKIDLLNTGQYLEMRKEAYQNDGISPMAVSAPDLLLWDTARYTDWQDVLLGDVAQYRDAQLSISGGERYTQFSVGGGYHRETTVFPGDNHDQRLSGHVNLINTSLNQKLKTNVSISYSTNQKNLLKRDLTSMA
jgi:TonB-linked SusC/RagA family outer membrane protein